METEHTKEVLEILPANIGALPSAEASPLLTRAASRIEIVRPKSEFWNGMKENLRGASAWIDAKKSQIASKTLRAVAGASLITTMISACAQPTETQYTPAEAPMATEVIETPIPKATPTSEPTQTPKPTEITPEATPEAVFVPEGFVIMDGGLLRNPETGKDVLAFNPEADWKRVREGIIGGLWQANMDWYKFTGQGSDAVNYSKEEFIKAALEGKVLRIGIPVRDNRVAERSLHRKSDIAVGIRFKTVEVKLDSIQVQLLDPNAFREHMGGKGWLAEDQEIFVLRFEDAASGNGSLLFEVNEQGQLVISVGSYYFGDMVAGGWQFEVGRFGNGLDKKYPSYFRSDGLGVNADTALSLYFASMTDWLNYLPESEGYDVSKEGPKVKGMSTPKTTFAAGVWDMDGWYLNPPVFIFVE